MKQSLNAIGFHHNYLCTIIVLVQATYTLCALHPHCLCTSVILRPKNKSLLVPSSHTCLSCSCCCYLRWFKPIFLPLFILSLWLSRGRCREFKICEKYKIFSKSNKNERKEKNNYAHCHDDKFFIIVKTLNTTPE